jgi:4-amino-4-deoxy-L-arabinose transferase-like glycosyltransferase
VISRQKLELCLLAGAVAVSRFAFRSHDLYDLDSVNFALAIGRFDPRVHQPHPPGYFLYICLGRLVNYLVHDANLALVILSILASIASVVLIYKLALDWFGPRAATFAGLLFLFSPLAWFHGTVALTYSVEAAASALLGLMCWRIDRGNANFVLPTAIVLGVAAGVRPSSILFLGPLFLFSLRHIPLKRILPGVAALGVTVAAWFLPMIWASGGFAAYFDALASLWRMVPSKDTVFNSSPVTSVARAIIIVFIYFLCFGAASLAPLGAQYATAPAEKSKKLFTAVWIVPALCFFTLIFLKLVNSGYLLLVAAPACVWLGAWAADWYEAPAWPRPLKQALIALCAAANVIIFLVFPAYCSYRSVRHFETELTETQTALPQLGAPQGLLIVAFDNHFLGYRHAGFYLPGYLTLEYPEATLIEGKRIFAMQGRDSFLLSQLPRAQYSRFVLFPLPAGQAEYTQYLEKITKLLPTKDLTSVVLEGHEFVTAPIADLPLLFPDAVTPPAVDLAPKVYTPRTTPSTNP